MDIVSKFVPVESWNDRVCILLTDFGYWAQHQQQLDQWCSEHNSCRAGMIVEFPDEKTLTLFALTWN